jgi:hypothetical protein
MVVGAVKSTFVARGPPVLLATTPVPSTARTGRSSYSVYISRRPPPKNLNHIFRRLRLHNRVSICWHGGGDGCSEQL